TRFLYAEGDVMQQRREEDASVVSLTEFAKEPDRAFFQDRVQPFDLFSERLYRLEVYTFGKRAWLFSDIHHTVYDGLSGNVFLEEVRRALAGEKLRGERLTAYDFALYEQELRSSETYAEAKAYFDRLAEGAVPAVLPDSPKPDGKPVGTFTLQIPAKEINHFCQSCGVTQGSFFEAAFGETLRRLTREEKPFYLTVSSGRSASPALMDSVGMFVKTLPVVLQNPGDMTAKEYVEEIHRQLQETYKRELYPYTELVEKHGLRGEIMFVYQGGILEEREGVVSQLLAMDTARFPVLAMVTPEKDAYRIDLEYDGRRYGLADMTGLARAFGTAALSLARAKELRDVQLVDESEARELLRLGAGRKMERDESETIVDILEKRVAESPDAPAVVYHQKTLTYRELDNITTRLAVFLQKTYQVGVGDIVGVMIDRSELMLIYPLAIIKTGAAYMPLDPAFPTERLSFMCEDAKVRLILSEHHRVAGKLPDFAGGCFESDALSSLPEVTAAEIAALTPPNAHDLFIILFTSGTTGKPKAVELEHYSIANFCHWYVQEYGMNMDDHVAAFSNFGFDAHMMDLYPSILAGSTVYIFDSALRMNLVAMNAYMEENMITVAFFTTQIGCMVSKINHSLRCLSAGGEKMPPLTAPDFRFLNGYGPTECSIYSTYYDVQGYYEGKLIGRPLPNYQVFIVDKGGNLVPRGISGELLIAGQGVARGYMNRPELNAEKFINFRPSPEREPIRAYRSGDLVRWSEDGNIEYLGRIDNQVKLRGLRIEMGEIENRAGQYEGLEQVAAAVRKDQLVLYYTASEGAEIDTAKLRDFLAQTLTEYMVPTVYMPLAVMPMTLNGKIDRKALPEPEISFALENVQPETEGEKKIFEVAAEILGTKDFGVTDNLVSLGLSSIRAMRLAAGLDQACALRIPVAEILRTPTVRALAAWSEGEIPGAGKQISPYPKRERYPITENQRGIIIDWEQNRETTQYNIPAVTVFDGVNGETLVCAVKAAVDAHGYLKTRFLYADGDVMQQRREEDAPVVSLTELDQEPDPSFFQGRILPFDLFAENLYRLEIYTFENHTWLFSDIHHTVYDGLSVNVFLEEVHRALAGEKLCGETLTAYDFALYEQELRGSETYAEAKAYFDRLAEGAVPAVLSDSPKPDEKPAGTFTLQIPAKEINHFCQSCGVTPGSFFEAAFGETLRRLTREEKPFYLTVSNGRSASPALMDSVGMFVKTLPVVMQNSGDMTAKAYVEGIHRQLQETYAREFYPYTELVENHGLRGEIMFVYHGGLSDGEAMESARPASMELELNAAKLPLSVELLVSENDYVLLAEYDGLR
ncbi:MAG: amino acid adenylation domain-containing protein, partial [Selenomonadaceae bacterium]|nr:amino acid adenylation domain-containing protein [Selenomonadaceae bacterium]